MNGARRFSGTETAALILSAGYALLLLGESIYARSALGILTAVLLVCGFLCGRWSRKGRSVLPLLLMILTCPPALVLMARHHVRIPFTHQLDLLYGYHSAISGGMLALGCIAGVYLLLRKESGRKVRIAAAVLLAILLAGLILSKSRTAILAAAVGILLLLARFIPGKYLKIMAIAAVVALIAGGYGLYRLNPDSFKGRLLIWEVSGSLVKEHPLAGAGIHSFGSHYPFAQAAYFQAHPDAPGARFADDINRPYNDWLRLLFEQGLGGILLLLLAVAALVWTSRKSPHARLARSLLSGSAVFALSSYPVESPGILLVTSIALGVLSCASGEDRKSRVFPVLSAVFLAAGLGLIAPISKQWEKDALKDIQAQHIFHNAPPEKAVPALQQLSREIPSAQLLVDLGDCQLRIGMEKEAISSYRIASWMVPKRLTARYRLFVVYKTIGDQAATRRIVQEILRYEPYYIPGKAVNRMLEEVHAYRDSLMVMDSPEMK